jgi:hypothetical protein
MLAVGLERGGYHLISGNETADLKMAETTVAAAASLPSSFTFSKFSFNWEPRLRLKQEFHLQWPPFKKEL